MSDLFDSERTPVQKVIFHYPILNRTVDLTGMLAEVPKELRTAQSLYERLDEHEQYLVSLFTLEDMDVDVLEEQRAFIHLLKKCASKIRSRGYAIGVRAVKA